MFGVLWCFCFYLALVSFSPFLFPSFPLSPLLLILCQDGEPVPSTGYNVRLALPGGPTRVGSLPTIGPVALYLVPLAEMARHLVGLDHR
jgi:hypothetical protein